MRSGVIFYGAILDGDGERCDRESGRAFRLWGTRGFEGRVGHEWFDDRVADERVPLSFEYRASNKRPIRLGCTSPNAHGGRWLHADRLQDEAGSL